MATSSPSSGASPEFQRHPLGLPAGSVRALLAFMVLAVLWALALGGEPNQKIPVGAVYLQYVMILILASFFAAHGSSIGRHISHHHPLGLPGGSVRFLLLAGYLGLVGWIFYSKAEFEEMPSAPQVLPLIVVTAFFLGYLTIRAVKLLSAAGASPDWFQDVQAWLALLATFGLTAMVLLHVFIIPSLLDKLMLDSNAVQSLEMGVAAILGFYFGVRS